MDPRITAICTEHRVVLRREIIALGYDDRALQRMVVSGELVRVRWGSYVMALEWEGADDHARYGYLCRAAYRRARADVALSHLSSAQGWGTPLWDVDFSEVHLTRNDQRIGRREAGVAQHVGTIEEGDWVELDGVNVMSPTRTALELTTLLDVEHSVVEIDYLLHQGLTTVEQLRARLATMTNWPGTLRTDLVLRLVSDRSESVGESRTRVLCWSQGLPRPEVNYEIKDERGRVIHRVDLAWPELGLFLEFDGKEKYLRHRREGESISDCVERERRRQNRIEELTGWRCIRIVWADLYRPAETADRIRRMFRQPAA